MASIVNPKLTKIGNTKSDDNKNGNNNSLEYAEYFRDMNGYEEMMKYLKNMKICDMIESLKITIKSEIEYFSECQNICIDNEKTNKMTIIFIQYYCQLLHSLAYSTLLNLELQIHNLISLTMKSCILNPTKTIVSLHTRAAFRVATLNVPDDCSIKVGTLLEPIITNTNDNQNDCSIKGSTPLEPILKNTNDNQNDNKNDYPDDNKNDYPDDDQYDDQSDDQYDNQYDDQYDYPNDSSNDSSNNSQLGRGQHSDKSSGQSLDQSSCQSSGQSYGQSSGQSSNQSSGQSMYQLDDSTRHIFSEMISKFINQLFKYLDGVIWDHLMKTSKELKMIQLDCSQSKTAEINVFSSDRIQISKIMMLNMKYMRESIQICENVLYDYCIQNIHDSIYLQD